MAKRFGAGSFGSLNRLPPISVQRPCNPKTQGELHCWFDQISAGLPSEVQEIALRLGPGSPSSPRVIVDIGANLGAFSFALCMRIGACDVHAFEAVPRYAKYISRRFQAWHVHNLALSNRSGVATRYVSRSGNLGWNTLVASASDDTQDAVTVPTLRLDSVSNISRLEHVDVIKIDTEGSEHLVLKGARRTIARFARQSCRPHLLIELGWGRRHPQWPLVRKEIERLFTLGYPRVFYEQEGTTDLYLRGTCGSSGADPRAWGWRGRVERPAHT